MNTIKRILIGSLLFGTVVHCAAVPTNAATVSPNKSESFESYSENSLYPSNKLWGSSAHFSILREDRNQYLHMPFAEENTDAAIIPFTGTVSPAQKSILIRMDLRPVYREGNGTAEYDFRVRNYKHEDENGKTLTDKWKSFFKLCVQDREHCYLSAFNENSTVEIPLAHNEWNTVLVSLDLVTGTYAVSVGEQTVMCKSSLKNLSFELDQLQFNQLIKGGIYAASVRDASFVDIDNISISPSRDLSKFNSIFRSAPKAELRIDVEEGNNASPAAGIRFLTEIAPSLMDELLRMKEEGEITSLRVGTLISPTDYLNHIQIACGLSNAAALDVQADVPSVYYSCDRENNQAYLAGSVLNLMEENYGRSFSARAYVSIVLATGQHQIIYSNTAVASANTLAANALSDAGTVWEESSRTLLQRCKDTPNATIGEDLRLMSYNIYYSDLREERMQNVVDMIKRHAPDVMGLQEATDEVWKPFLLQKLSSQYACVGHGREEGGVGEGTPILYRKDKFTLVSEGTYWLSDTPNEWSKYPCSRQSRIFTYVLLTRNSDGQTFAVVNTHLDTKGSEARLLQINALKKQIQALGLDDYPLLLVGDMNAKRYSADGEIDRIFSFGFTDSFDVAFQKTSVAMKEGVPDRIDYCFVEKENTVVFNYVYDTAAPNGDASDHSPVIIDFRFKNPPNT